MVLVLGTGERVWSAAQLLGVQVEPDDLGNLKDSMEHYLQDAAEPDFVEAGPLPRTPRAASRRHPQGHPRCSLLRLPPQAAGVHVHAQT